jgi:hypothetical protein
LPDLLLQILDERLHHRVGDEGAQLRLIEFFTHFIDIMRRDEGLGRGGKQFLAGLNGRGVAGQNECERTCT